MTRDAGHTGHRGQGGLDHVRWGTHAVEGALRAGRTRQLFLQQGLQHRPRLAALEAAARRAGIVVRWVPAEALVQRAATDRHQGAVAEVEPFCYISLDGVLARQRDEPPLLLALDGITDPQNLGAILRSADAAGVHAVILPERRAAPVTPAVARASAGAVDYLAAARVVNLPQSLARLKAAGIWVYGLDVAGDVPFDAADYVRPVAIVVGAEGKGLGRLVRAQCDTLVAIPLAGHVESLNVSVATALALFAARRARDRAGRPSPPGPLPQRGDGGVVGHGGAAAATSPRARAGRGWASGTVPEEGAEGSPGGGGRWVRGPTPI